MAHEWKTVSVKLNEELKGAVEQVCKQKGISPNKFLFELVDRETKHIRDPSVLPENSGIPKIGKNQFVFLPEKDTFLWQLDLGIQDKAILCEDASPLYLNDMAKAIQEGLKAREEFNKKRSGKAVIPPKLLRCKVR